MLTVAAVATTSDAPDNVVTTGYAGNILVLQSAPLMPVVASATLETCSQISTLYFFKCFLKSYFLSVVMPFLFNILQF